ncbi:formate dehydrogenase subunit delta [Hydrogenophaga sp.]|uniref:formate dehydrogenase subunit delta n=1 Tax=Hydrogenophaga sp. TaxID=1904254 RepID=UPI00271721C8|nr:formate dehydrogenase subunit delta [Hydrogenophaga sp.]MDO9436388.1 formate dehydrogenase subunit delta [Hydrogenophaga sp.]
MDIDNLVHMANSIGEFFASMPDQEEALDGIATHLKRYWEPRMRTLLLAHAERAGDASGLNSLVALAIQTRRDLIVSTA